MRRSLLMLLLCGLPCIPGAALAKEPAKASPVVVAARVGGRAIYVAEAEQELKQVLKGQAVEAAGQPRLLAEMLTQLVERRLVLQYLRSHDQGVDPAQVDAELAALASQLKQRGTTLPAYLASQGITEEALRDQIDWRLSWKSYVQRHVTDAVLERYFEAHRRDYDGTQVRAAQILLPLPSPADGAAIAAAVKQASQLRQQIVDGKVSFEDSATRSSAAPSKQQKGELGWLARYGALPEPVAAAAFALEAGQISQPIVTRFGVHLVKVAEIKPGTRPWRDSAADLQTAVVRRGFAKIAGAQRGQAAVEYTGAMPYLDPKTGSLVTAGKNAR